MAWFLNNISTYYILFSCVLIFWGVFAWHALYEVVTLSTHERCTIRRLDALYMCGISVCTTVLVFCLGLFVTGVASQFILHLFLFEVWYLVFAFFFTSQYLNGCLVYSASVKLLNRIKTSPQ